VHLWRNYRDRAALLEAAVATRSGQTAQALRSDQAVLGRLQNEKGLESSPDGLWLLERARLQTGDDLAAMGRPQEANDEWTAVVQSLTKPLENYEPDVLLILEAANERLGRSQDASAVAARLAALTRS
jgi:hypothetical protein